MCNGFYVADIKSNIDLAKNIDVAIKLTILKSRRRAGMIGKTWHLLGEALGFPVIFVINQIINSKASF